MDTSLHIRHIDGTRERPGKNVFFVIFDITYHLDTETIRSGDHVKTIRYERTKNPPLEFVLKCVFWDVEIPIRYSLQIVDAHSLSFGDT